MIEKIGVCNSTCKLIVEFVDKVLGLLINFVTPSEKPILEEIKNQYKNEIKEMILDV
jgi:hypothetical protein